MENNLEVLRIGKKMVDFEFEGYDPSKKIFSKFSLKESLEKKKWTLLVYYPADFTFICPTELADLAEKYDELAKMGVNVLSISTDTKFVHLAWLEVEKLLKDVKYFMASDMNGKIARRLGIFDENSGLCYRANVIINPDGILAGLEVNLNNVGRDMDELVRKMKAFIHTYNHPDEVCPAKWQPGKKTLKPSEKIVGKIFEALK